jgi:hypothetical protein
VYLLNINAMSKGIIRLSYRKVIDADSQNVWEKYVFEATYQEYLIQSQNYNPDKKYFTFAELKHHVPNADKLHFLVSASVINYLKQLNGYVPDILNNQGKAFLPFKNYRFEVIDSDVRYKSRHRITVEFISEPITWIDTVGNLLLVTFKETVPAGDDGILTEMFTMQPFLSIHSLKQEEVYDTAI